MAFARLFESEKYGQILMVRDASDDGRPFIEVSVEPGGYGVCSSKLTWEHSELGWNLMETYFEGTTLEVAEDLAKEIIDLLD
jgi:hypothetical protein